jgi:hypothetical protein
MSLFIRRLSQLNNSVSVFSDLLSISKFAITCLHVYYTP